MLRFGRRLSQGSPTSPSERQAAASGETPPRAADAWGALVPEGAAACALLRGGEYPLGPHRTVHLGRTVNPQRALCLPLQQVSCSHLSITAAGPATWLLIDDSTNGTWVDGVRAPRGCPMALRPGCRLVLCASDLACDKAVGFRFVVFEPAPGAARQDADGAGHVSGALLPPPPLDAAAAAAAAVATAAAGSATWQPEDGEAPPTQCAVCWNAHVRVLLLPCAHLCICAACDAGLARRVCPLCREAITASINVRFP